MEKMHRQHPLSVRLLLPDEFTLVALVDLGPVSLRNYQPNPAETIYESKLSIIDKIVSVKIKMGFVGNPDYRNRYCYFREATLTKHR